MAQRPNGFPTSRASNISPVNLGKQNLSVSLTRQPCFITAALQCASLSSLAIAFAFLPLF